MGMSLWTAKFLGPVFLAASTPMIISPQSIKELADDFLKSRSLIYISGKPPGPGTGSLRP